VVITALLVVVLSLLAHRTLLKGIKQFQKEGGVQGLCGKPTEVSIFRRFSPFYSGIIIIMVMRESVLTSDEGCEAAWKLSCFAAIDAQMSYAASSYLVCTLISY
jgi:hypothetical protein